MAWLLNESNFTWKDRFKICSFFLNKKKFWTMTDEVSAFEQKMADYVGSKHALFVSSGSTANTLLAMYLKDQLGTDKKNIVVFPSTTWITSVAPFIREGFTPHFIDINLYDLSLDTEQLASFLENNSEKVAAVFVTSLLGFSPNIDALEYLRKKYRVKIMLDNCESTFTEYKNKNISSYFTSTTSTYFGHVLQSVEGGFIFTNCDYEHEYFLMARNHGMTRSLKTNKQYYLNPDVDSRFDFNLIGNNFRNTNINAFIGQLDFERIKHYIDVRKELYDYFAEQCEKYSNTIVFNRKEQDVPFSLPFIAESVSWKKLIQYYCTANNIETRPIISGNLLRQTCLKKYGNPDSFENSELLHHNGLYVGLHSKVKKEDIKNLVKHFGHT
jgi:CDP-6-deoxy-D-xylo-4-hexulose-3-dehydrase